jgi:uncharacterized membrane protein YqhA
VCGRPRAGLSPHLRTAPAPIDILAELFIGRIDTTGPGMRLPGWLRMHDLNDLKARVISMIILVAAVTFVDAAVEAKGGLDTLYLGVGVAVMIAALTGFLRYGRGT